MSVTNDLNFAISWPVAPRDEQAAEQRSTLEGFYASCPEGSGECFGEYEMDPSTQKPPPEPYIGLALSGEGDTKFFSSDDISDLAVLSIKCHNYPRTGISYHTSFYKGHQYVIFTTSGTSQEVEKYNRLITSILYQPENPNRRIVVLGYSPGQAQELQRSVPPFCTVTICGKENTNSELIGHTFICLEQRAQRGQAVAGSVDVPSGVDQEGQAVVRGASAAAREESWNWFRIMGITGVAIAILGMGLTVAIYQGVVPLDPLERFFGPAFHLVGIKVNAFSMSCFWGGFSTFIGIASFLLVQKEDYPKGEDYSKLITALYSNDLSIA